MTNRQYTRSHRAAPLLSAEQLAELAAVVRGPAPEGDEWLGRTVAAWMSASTIIPYRVVAAGTPGAHHGSTPTQCPRLLVVVHRSPAFPTSKPDYCYKRSQEST